MKKTDLIGRFFSIPQAVGVALEQCCMYLLALILVARETHRHKRRVALPCKKWEPQ